MMKMMMMISFHLVKIPIIILSATLVMADIIMEIMDMEDMVAMGIIIMAIIMVIIITIIIIQRKKKKKLILLSIKQLKKIGKNLVKDLEI